MIKGRLRATKEYETLGMVTNQIGYMGDDKIEKKLLSSTFSAPFILNSGD